jgi:uncharacterized membrane protein
MPWGCRSRTLGDPLKQSSRIDIVLSKTLLYGVLASTGIVVAGLIVLVVTNSTGYACDSVGDSLNCILSYGGSGNAALQLYPATIPAIISGVAQGKSFAIIMLGVIVLLATPVLRVLTSLILFGLENDRNFVFITLFVLAVLLFSFFVVPFIPIFKA